MAVAESHLGRAVRCPHCQEAVATAAGPENTPSMQPLSETEQEQLFGLVEDAAPSGKPHEPANPAAPSNFAGDQPAPWQEQSTVGTPRTMDWSAAAPTHESTGAKFLEGTSPRAPVRRTSGWLLGLVIIPLISYSILATIVIIIQYQRLQRLTPDTTSARPASEKGTSRQ
jgi:hypothetical protein